MTLMTPPGAKRAPVEVYSMISVGSRGNLCSFCSYSSHGISDTAAPVSNSISIFLPFAVGSIDMREYLTFHLSVYVLSGNCF